MFSRYRSKSWAVRSTLALATLAIGYYGVAATLARNVAGDDLSLAHWLAPDDARITAAYSVELAQLDASQSTLAEADALAKQALREDPTAVLAAEALGMISGMRGNSTAEQKAFAYSERLSRRELRTRLWMIENAVQRGDVTGALHQYDIALRVLPNLAELLYPVLASSDSQISDPLVKTLASRPPWTTSFIEYLASKGPDRRQTAALLGQMVRAGVPVSQSASAYVIDALLGERHVAEAWTYYTIVRPGSDRRRSRDPDFTAGLESPSQFDWVPVNDGTVSSAIQRGLFDFSVPTGVGGLMLRQVQWLPAGRYRLSGRGSVGESDVRSLPFWSLSCSEERELGRIYLTPNGRFSGEIFVPADCPFQILSLNAQSSEAVSGTVGQIRHIGLTPEG